jgi:translation initiation factor IF-3
MRKTWKRAKPKIEKKFRSNEQIRDREIFLINEEGLNIGIIPTARALEMAKEAELDLIEVNPKAEPPVVRIMDYGQFKYEQEKKSKGNQKQKKAEQKEIRLSVRISSHDFDFRLNQAKKFLEKGHPLKAEIILKGRERQHPEKAAEVIKRFAETIEANENMRIEREQDLTKKGDRFNIILVAKQKKPE